MNDALAGLLKNIGVTEADPIVPLDIPIVDLALPYKPYQREALEWVFNNPRQSPHGGRYGMVALDMGLGKTPVGIGVAASVVAAGIDPRPPLIVVPPSLRMNWQREMAKFAPWLTYTVLTGTSVPDGFDFPKTDIILMGDSSLSGRKGHAGWVDFLVGRVSTMIVDESHRFKNKSGRSANMVKLSTCVELVKNPRTLRNERRQMTTVDGAVATPPLVAVPMSGTPAPNGRNQELVYQIDIMGDGAWKDIGGKGQFWNYYAPKAEDGYGTESMHSDELHEAMVRTWMFRRLRDEVEDLPNKGRSAVSIEAFGKSVNEYKRVEEDLIAWLADRQDGNVTAGQERAEAIIQLNYMRKLIGETKVKATVDHVNDLLDDLPGGVFVVAEHKDTIANLMRGLSKYNPVAIVGGMSDKQKDEAVQAFITGESRVMVGQITAAGVGLTLHGGGINHRVVVAQLPWTPAELRQAEDRLHRLGQTNDVEVEVMLAAMDGSWTIDERLWSLLVSKNFGMGTLIDGKVQDLLDDDDIRSGLLDTYRS